MSISVYYGRAGSGKTRAVYERIRQVMTDCPGGTYNLTRS